MEKCLALRGLSVPAVGITAPVFGLKLKCYFCCGMVVIIGGVPAGAGTISRYSLKMPPAATLPETSPSRMRFSQS
ncbi:MAG: hypothetical protein V4634_21010, partial [Pseudomonadota bacterium]